MTDAYIETTVLTDLLLKKDGSEKAADTAVRRFDRPIVSQFAWKEFKRGPLGSFIWFHNKLSVLKDYGQALAALQRLSRTPQRYLISTAIQAVHTGFTARFSSTELLSLQKLYGNRATMGAVVTDAMQLELKRVILQSWKKRNTLYGGYAQKLDCYIDAKLAEKAGMIDPSPRDCPRDADCCLRNRIVSQKSRLTAVWRSLTIPGSVTKPEWTHRKKVLRDIEKRPNAVIGPDECRRIGDAYFVLFCPENATIITTNVVDIKPMAEAVGIAFERP
jgi:hypothetical protein